MPSGPTRLIDSEKMKADRFTIGDPRYPAGVTSHLGNGAPKTITASGDLAVLRRKTLGLFCSVKCPGNLILQTYDLAQKLRAAGVTVIGGFHCPMEAEGPGLVLSTSHPRILCHCRRLPKQQTPEVHRLS